MGKPMRKDFNLLLQEINWIASSVGAKNQANFALTLPSFNGYGTYNAGKRSENDITRRAFTLKYKAYFRDMRQKEVTKQDLMLIAKVSPCITEITDDVVVIEAFRGEDYVLIEDVTYAVLLVCDKRHEKIADELIP